MLVSIMIGVILITFFVADIQRKSQVEQLENTINLKEGQIVEIEGRSINFTNSFLKSSVLLDQAREDRAAGSLPFDLAMIDYNTALTLTNITKLEQYKIDILNNCNDANYNYTNSHMNFLTAKTKFNETKELTSYQNYLTLLDSYMKLCDSGTRLTLLRQNASTYLQYLTENMTIVNNTIAYNENVSDLIEILNTTMIMYEQEAANYNEIFEEEIAEYDIPGFDPNR
jgi:hypothetical protein